MQKMTESILQLFLIVFVVTTTCFALPCLIVIALFSPSPERNAVSASDLLDSGLLRAGSWGFTALVFGVLCTAWFQTTSMVSLMAGIGIAVGVLPAASFQTM